jgi:hypothetical protein
MALFDPKRGREWNVTQECHGRQVERKVQTEKGSFQGAISVRKSYQAGPKRERNVASLEAKRSPHGAYPLVDRSPGVCQR